MSKVRVTLLVTAVLSLLSLFIVLQTPASLVLSGCHITKLDCSFQRVEGSLWSGRATNGVIAKSGYGVAIDSLSWKLSGGFTSELGPNIDLHVEDSYGFATAKLYQVGQAVGVHQLQGDYVVTQPNYRFETTVSVEHAVWDLESGIESLSGRVLVSQLAFSIGDLVVELGSFAGVLSATEGAIVVAPVTVESPYQVSGQCELKLNRYRCNLVVDAQQVNDERIHNGLALMGRRTGPGVYALNLSGAI
ncbi:type II secretion system protein N [Umboniibacter marinipuniceus]|uniref:Type II secretion system protein N n=1 Tax=Umboniibacter marinipuniceus TaxID=569599 RepID=A0A3M0A8X9_9GAMM|nr:type II secretion system protein N [Umboniibacter marinipuniceus]RMA81320.1 type II secretion system (T2SS) protein N [Umboniibacter marinipuniceus]